MPRRSLRLGCGALAALVACAPASTGAAPLEAPAGRFRRFDTSDGLSESRVRAMLQDRTGFLWICTGSGLDRYDASSVRTLRHDPADAFSLGPGMPMALVEDRSGALWVGLLGGGVSRYDPLSERFTRFRHSPDDPLSLSSDDVTSLAMDANGGLWVGSRGGLDYLDPPSGRVARVGSAAGDARRVPRSDVAALLEDRAGALWVGTASGLVRLGRPLDPASDYERWVPDARTPTSLRGSQVRALLEDRHGRIWVGTWDGALNRYEGGGFTRYELRPEAIGEPARIYGLLEDHRGAIWVATWGSGLYHLDPETGVATAYRPHANDPESLSHPVVVSLLEDHGGLLWVGTAGGGLSILDLAAKPFRRSLQSGEAGFDGSSDVRSVLEDRRGELWVGLAGGGLRRLGRGDHTLESFRHVPGDSGSLADDNVWALLEDRRGRLWVGTFGGLDRLDRVSRRFVHHRHSAGDPASLPEDTIYALHEDARGRLWVGTFAGLARFDEATGGFVRYRAGASRSPGSSQAVMSIADGEEGSLLLAVGRDVVRFDPESQASVVIDADRATGAVGPPSGVRLVSRAPDGAHWLASARGFVRLPPGRWDAREADRVEPDLFGAPAVSLEWAEDGTAWIGSAAGLVRYDPRSKTTRRYDVADGLPSTSFSPWASLVRRDGSLIFGTARGLVSFRPDEIRDDAVAPPVVLTGVASGTRTVGEGDRALAHALAVDGRELEVAHDERLLTFEFAALSYRAPRRNRFRYRLDGFDPGWNELASGRHEVSYTNLRPGRYLFRVTGSNGDGVWNETGASLRLRVLPPVWATWWFRTLAAALLLALALGAHRLRTRAMRERGRQLEQEVRERRVAQESLAENERLLRLIADAMPGLVAYVDRERRCLFANVASERWLRRSRDEIRGRPIDEVLPPDVSAAAAGPVERALHGSSESFEFDARAGAEPRRIAVTLVPHIGGDGGVRGFYTLAQDITARVRSEEAVRRQQEQLAHASRVLSLGEMAAALAHELNQPLTAILSNAQACLRLPAAARPEVEEVLNDIADDATRGGEIIRRLRELARRGEARMERLDLNSAVRGVEPLLRPVALEGGCALAWELDPALPELVGDHVQIQQVVLNLARNGVEAARGAPRERRLVRIRTLDSVGYAVTEISDSGPRVEDAVVGRLFEPFYTTKPLGLGMGLSISRSIVEAHGGTIKAVRNDAGGLTVSFRLPAPVTRPPGAGA